MSSNHNLLSHGKFAWHKYLAFCQFTHKNSSRKNSNISHIVKEASAKQKVKRNIVDAGASNLQDLWNMYKIKNQVKPRANHEKKWCKESHHQNLT